MDGNSDGNYKLWDTPHLSHLIQVPWESPISAKKRLAGGGVKPTEGMKNMGVNVQGIGKGGRE